MFVLQFVAFFAKVDLFKSIKVTLKGYIKH